MQRMKKGEGRGDILNILVFIAESAQGSGPGEGMCPSPG